jgi:hypothetical protein
LVDLKGLAIVLSWTTVSGGMEGSTGMTHGAAEIQSQSNKSIRSMPSFVFLFKILVFIINVCILNKGDFFFLEVSAATRIDRVALKTNGEEGSTWNRGFVDR